MNKSLVKTPRGCNHL